MKYYMITFKGHFSDASTITQMIWISQDAPYFDGDAFKAELDDQFSEGDQEFAAVILFMRECSETEFEVNKHGQKSQSQ